MMRMIFILMTLLLIVGENVDKGLAQDKSVLQGQVYIANFGTPLSDVQLTLRAGDKTILQTKTDQDGNYKITELTAREYQLEVLLAGFRQERVEFSLESGKPRKLDVGLKMGHWVNFAIIGPDGKELQNVDPSLIGGTVKQSDGKPINNATVVLISLFSNDMPVEVQTNAKGQYSLRAVEGQFVIYVYKRGYKAQSDTMLLGYPSYGFTKDFILKKMTDQ